MRHGQRPALKLDRPIRDTLTHAQGIGVGVQALGISTARSIDREPVGFP
jgi:hypothetical protein